MSNGILVYCEFEGGQPRKTAFELLQRAVALGVGPVYALVIGDADPSSLGANGASKVYQVSGPAFASYSTGAYTTAFVAALGASGAGTLLASASSVARDALPRVAARVGAGLGVECTQLSADGGRVVGRRPVYAGKALVDVRINSAVGIFTLRPNSYPVGAAPGGSASVVLLDAGVTDADVDVRVVSTVAPDSTAVDLTEAERIVSGGGSLKSMEQFDGVVRPLAAALGATVGASRAAVDAGYAGHGEQVGQTGKVVNPSLYIALGISGAIQHLAGMRTSRVIVAVNKDAEAPIFQYATYGIVGDLFEVAPLLQAELARG
jgi:electron transfer flavoprotein alpha subunit